MKIVIPFVQITAHNPNIGRRTKSSTLDTYLRCIIVAFYSLRHFNPDCELQLTTNKELPEPYNSQLISIGVSTIIIEYIHNPPAVFGDSFRGCFYLFDAIIAEEESALFIDPDIYCSKKIPLEIFTGNTPAALNMKFEQEREVNGLNLFKAREIFAILLKLPPVNSHNHLGGEAVFIPKQFRNKFIADFERIWQANTKCSIEGKEFLTTEEHIISLALSNDFVIDLDEIILRIWTDTKYRRIEGGTFNPEKIPLWHLPAEKSYGFYKAYKLASRNKLFDSHNEEELQNIVLKLFNIDRSRIETQFSKFLTLVEYRLDIFFNLIRRKFST
jgi:hypothetical protein